jgi:hypothetical protein
MNLTQHFTLAELTASNKARELGIDNTPRPELVPRLVMVAEMLERIRSTLNCPVVVTSGYRCEALNLAVGGSSTSDHPRGHAADIVSPRYGTATEVARTLAPLVSVLGIGQIILEGIKGRQWLHVSTRVPELAVNRVITITDSGVRAGIHDLA